MSPDKTHLRNPRYYLGLDPSLTGFGWCIIQAEQDGKESDVVLSYESSGVIKTTPKSTMGSRLYKIKEGLTAVIRRYAPEAVCAESISFEAIGASKASLATVHAVIFMLAEEFDLELFAMDALNGKRFATGRNKATKIAVKKGLAKRFGAEIQDVTDDESDAAAFGFAIASCKEGLRYPFRACMESLNSLKLYTNFNASSKKKTKTKTPRRRKY